MNKIRFKRTRRIFVFTVETCHGASLRFYLLQFQTIDPFADFFF